MQLKTYTWKSYTFLIVSIFVTINLFLFTPIFRQSWDRICRAFRLLHISFRCYSNSISGYLFCSRDEKKILAIIGLCFTLFNTAIILFFLWFGYHFT